MPRRKKDEEVRIVFFLTKDERYRLKLVALQQKTTVQDLLQSYVQSLIQEDTPPS